MRDGSNFFKQAEILPQRMLEYFAGWAILWYKQEKNIGHLIKECSLPLNQKDSMWRWKALCGVTVFQENVDINNNKHEFTIKVHPWKERNEPKVSQILAKYSIILYINYLLKFKRLCTCTSCVRAIYHKMESGQDTLDNKINFSHRIFFVCKFYFARCLLKILRHFWNDIVNIKEMLWQWTCLFLAISENNNNVCLLTESSILKRIYFISLKNMLGN